MKNTRGIKNRVRTIKSLREDAKISSEQIKAAQTELLDLLDEDGLADDGYSFNDDDYGVLRVTVVQPTKTDVDVNALRKLLTAEQWEAVTSRVLDMGKLEAAMKAEEVDPKVVAKATTTTPGTRYVKVV